MIERIDRELDKQQADRVDFKVVVQNPRTLKNHLEIYKSMYRKDWYQRFQMWAPRGSETLSFKFNHRTNNAYKILEEPLLEEGSYVIEEERQITPATGGVPLELNDLEVAGCIIELQPEIMVLSRCLSPETLDFLNDMPNSEPTALINLATRNGYTIDNLNERVRFSYGGTR